MLDELSLANVQRTYLTGKFGFPARDLNGFGTTFGASDI